jgi:hypothetical protein
MCVARQAGKKQAASEAPENLSPSEAKIMEKRLHLWSLRLSG